MDLAIQQYKILSWNVRGMNSGAKQEDVKHTITTYMPELVCLQETKFHIITMAIVRNVLGTVYLLQQLVVSDNTIIAQVTDCRNNQTWTITTIYGPQVDLDKKSLGSSSTLSK
jgi:hypothetical protein